MLMDSILTQTANVKPQAFREVEIDLSKVVRLMLPCWDLYWASSCVFLTVGRADVQCHTVLSIDRKMKACSLQKLGRNHRKQTQRRNNNQIGP